MSQLSSPPTSSSVLPPAGQPKSTSKGDAPMPLELPAVRILIVDDDKAICEYMQTLLERDGFQVKTLSDPTGVEEEVRSGGYHMIILDLMMPKLDGIEVLRRVRKLDTDIAVVIFTGFPNLESAVASMKFSTPSTTSRSPSTSTPEIPRRSYFARDAQEGPRPHPRGAASPRHRRHHPQPPQREGSHL